MLKVTRETEAARAKWRYRGQDRPDFAHAEGVLEESVWDYPRPPVVVADARLVQVLVEDKVVASSRSAVRVLETASPPTFYLPPDDVEWEWLAPTDRESLCEWKGVATSFDLVVDADRVAGAAWVYERVFPPFADIQGWASFYPGKVTCLVEGETVYPQPGGYYGGWVTREIMGPFKGEPGTETW
jgi:uncharacterized protein (DUF427 family)